MNNTSGENSIKQTYDLEYIEIYAWGLKRILGFCDFSIIAKFVSICIDLC